MEARRQGTGPTRRGRLMAVGLVASGLVAGAVLAGTQMAGAETTTSTGTPSATAPAVNGVGPSTVSHGPGETLLTGETATKVETAALAEVPGGTIIRVETDSSGSPYEAHVRKSDGSIVTVFVDENFQVTSVQSGFGTGAPGSAPSSGTSA
jgi:hypothetical protein